MSTSGVMRRARPPAPEARHTALSILAPMRRLLLMRHGKSDWDAPYGTDHDRPLAPRGERAARTMGRVLQRMGEIPETMLSSSAVRARTTAELARVSGGWPCPLTIDDGLYGTGAYEALHIAAAQGGDAKRLMLVGHEPTWSDLTGLLTGARAHVKTATVVGIDLGIDRWLDAPDATGVLAYLLNPRMFTDGEWVL